MSNKTRFIVCSIAITTIVLSACSGDAKQSDRSSEAPVTEAPVTDAPVTDALATDAMVPAIQRVIELGASDPTVSAPDLSACPLGDFDALVAKAPAEVSARASLDGELEAYVYQPGGDQGPPHLQCGRGDLGAYTGLVPEADYHDELIRLLPDFVLTFDDDTAHLGGTIVSFCAEPIGVGFGAFCEADWYDSNVWIGVFIYGVTAAAEPAEQWLIAVLGDVVANVPQVAPTVQLAA